MCACMYVCVCFFWRQKSAIYWSCEILICVLNCICTLANRKAVRLACMYVSLKSGRQKNNTFNALRIISIRNTPRISSGSCFSEGGCGSAGNMKPTSFFPI